MKYLLIALFFSALSLNAFASSETESGWFDPVICDKGCQDLLKPGQASLANEKGVYKPSTAKSKTKKKKQTPAEVSN